MTNTKHFLGVLLTRLSDLLTNYQAIGYSTLFCVFYFILLIAQ